MGEVEVPFEARWGAQTQRAVENFPISGQGIGRELIWALGRIKEAAAVVNGRLGVIEPAVAVAVASAAAEVAEGRWDDHFPVDIFQTGSGTSSNMNANEVLASLATERLDRRVHPDDGRCTPMTTSTPPSRRTTCSRRRSTWRRCRPSTATSSPPSPTWPPPSGPSRPRPPTW